MSENQSSQISFTRSKSSSYGILTVLVISLGTLSSIDTSFDRYFWIFGLIICLALIVKLYYKPIQQIEIFDKAINIHCGAYVFSAAWEDIIAVDFKRMGNAQEFLSGPFRIVTKDNRKSILLKSRGWRIREMNNSPDISNLISKLKPMRSSNNMLPVILNHQDKNERLQLILDIIESKSGIKASFGKAL